MTTTSNPTRPAGGLVLAVGHDEVPWVDTGTGVDLQLLRVNLDEGVWVLRNRFAPGVLQQIHKHTGAVEGFTLSGRWHYLEQDFWSTAGSYIHEPAGSVHTLHVPDDNDGPTDVLFIINGALLYLGPDDEVQGTVDAGTILEAYVALCEAAGHGDPSAVLRV